jgi:PAS domain S-box-containing protein
MGLEAQLETIGSLFGASLDPVIVVGGAGRVLYANPAARQRWPEGASIAALSPLGDALAPVLARGEPARLEWGDRSPAGVRAWYSCAISPVSTGSEDEPRVVAWLCVSTEVTELKRTEERMRRAETLMVDTQGVAHLGTWEWDLSEPHAFWSAELYRIYGLTPETYTPTYEAYLTLVHPEDRQRVIDATNRVFHEHVPYSHDERIFRPDGSMRHLHTWAHPILDDAGKLRRLVGVCQDITERQEAEEKVRQMNAELELRVAERTRQLEASMRDLESFNAMVSHDLRAPLSVIQLSSRAIGEPDPSRPAAARAVERIGRAVAQMATLIDDLLAFASLGDATLHWADVDLSELARGIVADLEQAHPARAVEVGIEAGVTCLGDAGLMRVVLQNILGNAWKYTSAVPAARIDVTTATVEGRRVLVVRDNGAGFDMKDAHRLFVPFQRLHSDREFSGTGVGLASARRILERHGARVWAEGVRGHGATFFIELPRAP